jgi:hypothetical protein
MPYEDETWIAETATLGSFTLTESLISKMDFWEKISPNNPPSSLPNATISDGTLYSGDPASPQIGDIRVSFRVVLPGLVSIVAEQQGNTFKPYTTKNGRTIEMVSEGNVPADDMFAAAQKGNKQMGWILRLVGFVIMFIGLGLVFKPLSVVMDVLPILGDITGMATGFIAFMLSVVFSFITIAVAWIFYRPVFGVILLAVAIGIIVYLRMKKGEASA